MVLLQTQRLAHAASSQESCFCGHNNWCYLIKDQAGQLVKAICGRTLPEEAPEGWEHRGTAKDGRPIFTKKGHRQRKRWSKWYPELIQLQLEPKEDIPQWTDTVIPIEQLFQGDLVLLKPGNPGGSDTVYQVKKTQLGKRNGINTLIAILVHPNGFGGTLEVPLSEIAEVLTRDLETGAKEQFTEYCYSNTQKVVRTQWTDRRAVYSGGQSKKIRPFHQGTDGNWIPKKGDDPWPLYRQNEAVAAIRNGGVVFAVGGEQAVEEFRKLGLTATCNQGGEGSYHQIVEVLAPNFHEVFQLTATNAESGEGTADCKPLLVAWGDNDPKGEEFSQGILKDGQKHKIAAITIDPLELWPGMPAKGDVKDWLGWCHDQGMSDEEILTRLELAIDTAIDEAEADTKHRWRRDKWKAPSSWDGEIGIWKESSDGCREFIPLCDFDFVVVGEVMAPSGSPDGGGWVMKVKRADDGLEAKVMLSSLDCQSVKDFNAAINRVFRANLVCRLNNSQLAALIRVRLGEYRTNRKGKVYRRIDRFGQQEDGTWVFRDRQFTKDGQPTNQEKSLWVFDPNIGAADHIPCPEILDANPQALRNLIEAQGKFAGSNFMRFLLCDGYAVASLHYQQIIKEEKFFPILNPYGDGGGKKTVAVSSAISLVWGNTDLGSLASSSLSMAYERLKYLGSIPSLWDDLPGKSQRDRENIDEFMQRQYNALARSVRGNTQHPHSPVIPTANFSLGETNPACKTRIIPLFFPVVTDGDRNAWDELSRTRELAPGAFSQLISIGYPKAEVRALRKRLAQHLPNAHDRAASNLAVLVFYTQKVVELAGLDIDVEAWVIENLCPSLNESQAGLNSAIDFFDKLESLKDSDLIGSWNADVVETRQYGRCLALHLIAIWKELESRFTPVYNRTVLERVLVEMGAINKKSAKLYESRDLVLSYKRALLIPRTDSDDNPLLPLEPNRIPKKCLLIPERLWEKLDLPWLLDPDPNQSPDASEGMDIPSGSFLSPSPRDNEEDSYLESEPNYLSNQLTESNDSGSDESHQNFSQVTLSNQSVVTHYNLGLESDSVFSNNLSNQVTYFDSEKEKVLEQKLENPEAQIASQKEVTLVTSMQHELQTSSERVVEESLELGYSQVTSVCSQVTSTVSAQSSLEPSLVPAKLVVLKAMLLAVRSLFDLEEVEKHAQDLGLCEKEWKKQVWFHLDSDTQMRLRILRDEPKQITNQNNVNVPLSQLVPATSEATTTPPPHEAVDSTSSADLTSVSAETQMPLDLSESRITSTVVTALKVGDKVWWDECPAHCQQFAPFEIMSLDGDYAKLDLINKPVLVAELRRVE